MTNSIELILIFFVFFLLAKYAPFLVVNIQKKRKEKLRVKNLDFDSLVEREKIRLGSLKNELPKESSLTSKTKTNDNPQTPKEQEDFIINRLKTCSSDNAEFKEHKKTLELIEEARWGEGKHLKTIQNHIHKQSKINPELLDLAKILRFLIKNRGFLYGDKELKVYFFSDLMDVFYCFWQLGQMKKLELDYNNFFLKEKISPEYFYINDPQKVFLVSIQFYFDKIAAPELSILPYLKKSPMKNSQNSLNDDDFLLFKKTIALSKAGRTKKWQDIENEIIDNYKSFFSLWPLPNKKQIDKNGDFKTEDSWARSIFSIQENEDLNEKIINNRYKSLAKIRHPDRLLSLAKTNNTQKLAKENFQAITEAKEILLKKLKAK